MRWLTLFVFCVMCIACTSAAKDEHNTETGTDFGQIGSDIEAEWPYFQAQHAALSPEEARKQFNTLQALSAKAQADIADAGALSVLYDRRALADAWIKKEISDTFKPSDVSEAMLRAAYDSFSFDTGHPELITVSHLLWRESKTFNDARAKEGMQRIFDEMQRTNNYTDEALKKYAFMITQAGERADMNADLSFPRRALPSFMGLQQNYPTMVEPFAQAAFALDESRRLSLPVRTEFGYHLILFKQKRLAYQPHFDEVREYLRAKILEHARRTATNQLLEELQNKANIRINEDALRRIAQGD